MARGGQGLARVAVVVRAGAAPLWWAGVFAAGVGVLPPGITGRRIGVMAGAALFLVTAAAVAVRGRRRERAGDALLWVRVDWLGRSGGGPAGKAVKGYRGTGIAAGDATPGGARRRTDAYL